MRPRSSFNLNSIEKEVYAHLITEYILHKESMRPRFIMLGFDDIRNRIYQQFEQSGIPAIEPELIGRLKEASLLRGKSEEPCVILISRKNLGKFASLVTAFKVLGEAISINRGLGEGITDVYCLLDVSEWLICDAIGDLGQFIESKVGKLQSGATYDGVKAVLNKIRSLAKEKPSFAEWIHPRRILKGLIRVISEEHTGHSMSIASFLRSIGIESKAKLENIPLFASNICTEKNLRELRNTLLGYSRVLKKYTTPDVSRQRKNLADLCMNHLRNLIYRLADTERRCGSKGEWIGVFCDFEYSFTEKTRRKRKKYRVESRGVRIRERSKVSGLPLCIWIPIEVTLEEEEGRNLLQEFWNGKLNKMFCEYSKLCSAIFQLKPLSITDSDRKLLLEFSVPKKDGNVTLDPFLDGLKSPTPRINRLLALIQRMGGT